MATTKDKRECIVEAFAAGANDYIIQPMDFAVALARLKTQLSLGQHWRETTARVDADRSVLGGRYRLLGDLATEGLSQTHLVQDLQRPGEPICVVKQLHCSIDDQALLTEIRHLFQAEAVALEKLGKHDQIPQLLAFFEQDQEFYLIQEYVKGSSLAQELHLGTPWAESQVIALLTDILKILEFVHAKQLIHCDVTPQNLIRREDGKLVLIDFGIAQRVHWELHRDSKPILGNPDYMPIEQSIGKPLPCSDIYACGIMAIQALTGKHPDEFQVGVQTGELDWQEDAKVSSALVQIINKMIYQNYRTRYQSASAVLHHLGQIG
jgi:serine/threonine-protein kinase